MRVAQTVSKMACFRRRQRYTDCFRISELPHHNHIRVLPERTAQTAGKAPCITPHLPLVNQRQARRINIFYRVLQRQHVYSARLIYLLYQRGKRCAFTAAGSTGDKQQTAAAARKLTDNLRQAKTVAVRNILRQQTNRRRITVAKTVNIQPAALLQGIAKGSIHLACLQQLPLFLFRQQGKQRLLQLFPGNNFVLQRLQAAIYAHHRHFLRCKMQVTGSHTFCLQQQLIKHYQPPR